MALREPECGQMTVEFAVALPVVVVIAVIAVNALAFFSDCAAFDNLFRDAMRCACRRRLRRTARMSSRAGGRSSPSLLLRSLGETKW